MFASLHTSALALRGLRAAPGALLLSRVWQMIELARQRRALALLDAHRLRDLGLTKAQARAEADRLAWDVPAHWRA